MFRHLTMRGISSVGRASGWQPEGQGFKSPILHFALWQQAAGCSRPRQKRPQLALRFCSIREAPSALLKQIEARQPLATAGQLLFLVDKRSIPRQRFPRSQRIACVTPAFQGIQGLSSLFVLRTPLTTSVFSTTDQTSISLFRSLEWSWVPLHQAFDRSGTAKG